MDWEEHEWSGLVRGEKGWKNGKWKNERLEDMGGLTDD